MDKTKIDWADMSWNPVTGCRHGCEYCYARRIAERFGGFEPRSGGEDVPEDKKKYGKNSIWNATFGEQLHTFTEQPMKRTAGGAFQKASYPYNFEPTFHRYRLGEPTRKQRPRNIFVGSMADIFGDWVPDGWIQEIFAACGAAPQHNYLFLTKNPYRYMDIMETLERCSSPHLFFGITISNEAQAREAQEVIDHCYADLMLYLSIEPLHADVAGLIDFEGVKWAIIGAETGNRKNRVVPDRKWVENIVDACRAVNIPVFMKNNLVPVWNEPLIQEFPAELRRK